MTGVVVACERGGAARSSDRRSQRCVVGGGRRSIPSLARFSKPAQGSASNDWLARWRAQSARRSARRRRWWLRTGSWFTLPAYATTAAARARARPGAARPPARADRPGQAAVPARYGRNRRWRVNPFPHCEGSPSITFLRVPWRRRGCNASQLPGSLYRAASPASGPSPGFRHVHSGKMLALTVRSRRELEVINGRGTGG